MKKLKYKLYYFMQGRRGADHFSRFLMNIALVLILVSIFTRKYIVISFLLNLFILALLVYTNFRVFSRNLYKRELENNRYLVWRNSLKERKKYKYFKCPQCGQKMRAPRGSGKIRVTCHQCNASFKKNV